MCGIAGIIGHRPNRDWREWAALTDHRGPDSLGLWNDERALLAHNRLAILDLSSASNQPFVSICGRYILVFNGEIFNFLFLKRKLLALGVIFRTESDTEVLLEAYLAWGVDALRMLDGMFAFAVWDRFECRLFAARDHAGIKPLFYSFTDESFVFGSEIKTLLRSGCVSDVIRSNAVDEYLSYGYIPSPHTAFQHIKSLEAGQYLYFNLENKKVTTQYWWKLPLFKKPLVASYHEATEELSRLLSESVKLRMIADVPVGAFLSGGVDSSVIVSEMSKHSASRVKTFSVGYDAESGYDESKYAEQIANYLGLEHRTIFPKYRSQDLNESIDHILDHIDQPYANPTVMLTSLLTATVRNEVKVALIGDGADELFGGYPRHWAIGIQSKFGPIVRTLRRPLIASLNLIPETPKGNHLARRFRRFCNSSNSDLAITYEESTRLFTSIELNSITSYSRCGESGNRTFLADLFRDAQGSPLVRACSADQRSFLTNNLLDGADRLSMANGFELRLPFLDRALMEFAATLPADYRIRGRVQKRVLKDAYRGKLPETVFNRAKRGFNPPVWHWLKGSRSMLGQLSSRRSPLADYINPAATHRMLERFDANLEDNSTQLWALLVLERWLTRRN